MSRATATQPKSRAPQGVALSAQLIEIGGAAPSEFRLLPAGTFRARDGRPQGLPGWTLDTPAAEALIARAAAQRDRFLIDYDHQTLHVQANGAKAPAAGWFGQLDWRPGDGLYATDVEWTAAARAAIEAHEYRYISPVLTFDETTGAVTGLIMAALVNYPALDGLTDLAAAHFLFSPPRKASPMDDDLLERLRYLLNLPITATPQDLAAELDKLKALITGPDGQTQGLAAALAARPAAPDPTQYAPVAALTALQGELATLRAELDQRRDRDRQAELAGLIEPALAHGRLLPGQKDWAETLGQKDIEALKAFLASAQPLAALRGTQTGGKGPATPAVSQFKVPPGMTVDPGRAALNARIEAYAQEHQTDFATAALAVGA